MGDNCLDFRKFHRLYITQKIFLKQAKPSVHLSLDNLLTHYRVINTWIALLFMLEPQIVI